mmetsp:Transcript_46198/g.75379  ORF Transcript_46198/g.75379 Transcript_46198/m.75379 type:complete len:95 (-) Transcript_46198:459-743(-)
MNQLSTALRDVTKSKEANHFRTTFAFLISRKVCTVSSGIFLILLKRLADAYLSFVFGSVYLAGKPVTSQYRLAGNSEGGASIFTYVGIFGGTAS